MRPYRIQFQPRQDMLLVIQFRPAPRPVPMHHFRQKDHFIPEPLPPLHRNRLDAIPLAAPNIIIQTGHSLLLQPFFNELHRLPHLRILAIYIAPIQQLPPRPPAIRLPHYPPHQLRYRPPSLDVIQDHQQIRKGTIPTLHQRRLRYNPPHRRKLRPQIHPVQFPHTARLHRHFLHPHPQIVRQILPHILRMNPLPVPLIFPRPLHPHHRDGADIPPSRLLQCRRFMPQPLQPRLRRHQCIVPFRIGRRLYFHRQFNHFLRFQINPRHIHQQITAPAVGRRRQLNHHPRIQPVYRGHKLIRVFRLLPISLMRLIQHNHRTQHLEHINQTMFDRPVLRIPLQIGILPQQPPIPQRIIAVGKKRNIPPRIPEHPQKILVPLPVRRLQRHQHHAQIIGYIPRRE